MNDTQEMIKILSFILLMVSPLLAFMYYLLRHGDSVFKVPEKE